MIINTRSCNPTKTLLSPLASRLLVPGSDAQIQQHAQTKTVAWDLSIVSTRILGKF